jgi:hypothetical protein
MSNPAPYKSREASRQYGHKVYFVHDKTYYSCRADVLEAIRTEFKEKGMLLEPESYPGVLRLKSRPHAMKTDVVRLIPPTP